MTVGYEVKSLFFDRRRVTDAVGKTSASIMARQGGFARTTAQRSMRRVGRGAPPSPAGQPPRARARGFGLRDALFFSFDPATASVVVGPARGNRGRGDVPRLQEEGGRVTRVVRGRARSVLLPARPTMKPALEKTLPKTPLFIAQAARQFGRR